MKQFHIEQPIQSPDSKMTMPKDDTNNPEQSSNDSNAASEVADAVNQKPKLLGSSARLARDVCDPKFGSWCDDSSTDEEDDDDEDDDDSLGGSDCIVINMASLSTETCYSSFYFSCSAEKEERSVQSHDEEQIDEEEDFHIRISQKRRSDEEIFLDNLRRRQLRFSDQPKVTEFEPAPDSCHTDMYYSCHQLQKMMDAYRQGIEYQLED